MKPCRKGVVGGTFSLLHEGHRLLLAFAAKHSEKLLVGVTSDSYVASRKSHPVEPFSERARAVVAFLEEAAPDVKVHVVEIDDPYGPSVDDEEADCIFVSEETFYGAFLINVLRRIKGLPPLRVFSVELLTVGGVKLSSTLLWKKRLRATG